MPHISAEQLNTIYDYTKFHVGLYAGTVAGFLAICQMRSKTLGRGSYVCLCSGVVFVVLAGACGGTVLSNIADPEGVHGFWGPSSSTDTLVGGFRDGWQGLALNDWMNWEHRCFWLGVCFLMAGTLLFRAHHAENLAPSEEPAT